MGQIENMKKLGMTDEEIADVLACDSAIDKTKNEKPIFPWEMSAEEHKKAVKAANSDEKQQKTPKQKPKSVAKIDIFCKLHYFLCENAEKVRPAEDDGEIFFEFGGEKFAIKLRNTRK